MTPSRLILSTLLILSLASVSACGRRAALDRPSDARYEREREEAKKAGLPAPARPPAAPERRFILDGLID